jgi:Putative transmembrane family 234
MEVLWIILVGIIWGSTNVYMEKGTQKSLKLSFLPGFLNTFLHPEFLVPYGMNQLGSVLYYFQLGQVDLKIAVPLANSITFLTTTLLSKPSIRTYIGGGFIITGVTLCLTG